MSIYSEEFQNNKKKHKNIYFRNKKLFVTKSLLKCNNEEREKIKKLLKEFKEEESKDYFKTHSNIFFGKKLEEANYNQNKELFSYSLVGSDQNIKRNISLNRNDSSLSNLGHFDKNYFKKKTLKKNNFISRKSSSLDPYDYVDDNALKMYFNNIKLLISNNKKSTKIDDINNEKLPSYIEKSLDIQSKILSERKKQIQEKKKIEKKILKKCNQKSNLDLLINKDEDLFLYKTLKRKQSENKKSLGEKYNLNLWNITLRNSRNKDNSLFEWSGYYNMGRKDSPLYSVFPIKTEIEYYSKPNMIKNAKLSKNRKTKTLEGLEIKGKNLLNIELKRETGFRGRKLLFRNGEIDLFLKKKKEQISTINSKIRNLLFDDKVYAVNYGTNNKSIKNYVNSSRTINN